MRSSGLLLAKLFDTLSALNGLDLSKVCDDTVRSGVLDLLVSANRTQAQLTRFLTEFERRGLASADGVKTSKAWLQSYGRLSGPAAHAQLRAVRTVAALPRLAEALDEGAVALAHVNRIGLVLEQLGMDIAQSAEQILVDLARAAGPTELHRACVYLRKVVLENGLPALSVPLLVLLGLLVGA